MTHCSRECGISLIAMAMIIMVGGFFMIAGVQLYEIWEVRDNESTTDRKLARIQEGLEQFLVENGRYPCPAPLDAALDTPEFGVEVSDNCEAAGDVPGTFRAPGRDGRMVRTGAVPVRTLGVADSLSFDAYKKRFVYAVTEEYAGPDIEVNADNGAIAIVDGNDNNATATPGNIVRVVYSMGSDDNGAYTVSGALLQPCDSGGLSGENCDFDTDATFRNTIAKSRNDDNPFVHKLAYAPARHVITCVETGLPVPRKVAFLIDTSGSMEFHSRYTEDGFTVQCPSSMPNCSRIDVARWAMRRAVPARLAYNAELASEAGSTAITGFVARNNVANVLANLGDPTFDDPTQPGYTTPADDEIRDRLENELQGMCPDENTPLGIHIEALAETIGDGEDGKPNKIIVISDGVSNNGKNPKAAAEYIRIRYPHLQVDIIDVVGNPSLMDVATLTGGRYYSTNNPDELLDSLYSATGVCGTSVSPTAPVDRPGCGSAGKWWE